MLFTTRGESYVSEWKQICVIYCHSDSLNTSLRLFKEGCRDVFLAGQDAGRNFKKR